MWSLRRCLAISRRRLPAPAIARNFTASSTLNNGNLADVCNLNVMSSPFPPVMDSSKFMPAPEFISSGWKDAALVDKIAIRDGSTGETRTFSQYDDYMNRIASCLRSEYSLKPNETAALYSPNNVDYLPICLAVGLCGAKVTPINPLATVPELTKILVPSNSKVLITHAKLLEERWILTTLGPYDYFAVTSNHSGQKSIVESEKRSKVRSKSISSY